MALLVWDIYYTVLKRMVDREPIYTERLFGTAMKKTDKTLCFLLRFLKTTPFVVFVLYFLMVWPVFCCVLVPGTLAFHSRYTLINCDCLVYSVSQSVTTQ